jgi:hypothetical protein
MFQQPSKFTSDIESSGSLISVTLSVFQSLRTAFLIVSAGQPIDEVNIIIASLNLQILLNGSLHFSGTE